jgi:2,5-diketo-D-gluconate reductase B
MPSQPSPTDVPHVDEMPMLGLGTWENDDHDACVESVRTALEIGYRHVDTAQAYGNESAVGEAIDAATVARENVFLATKVWTSNLAREDVIASTEASLDRLGTDYVDLLYVHWPAGEYDPENTLPAFDDLRDRGLINHVGVSNFEPAHVDRAREILDAPIFANQVELHPQLPQEELREYAEEMNLHLVAYSPLVRGDIVTIPEIRDIAKQHDASEAQIGLAWLRENGITAIPKATSEAHIRDNWASLPVELHDADRERIDGIETRTRKVRPPFAPAAWN